MILIASVSKLQLNWRENGWTEHGGSFEPLSTASLTDSSVIQHSSASRRPNKGPGLKLAAAGREMMSVCRERAELSAVTEGLTLDYLVL